MTDLAADIILEAASMRLARVRAKRKQARKDSARHKKTNARIARNVVKRNRAPKGTGACENAPWNKLHPESEMRLYLCESVRKRLMELENEEYERKHHAGTF